MACIIKQLASPISICVLEPKLVVVCEVSAYLIAFIDQIENKIRLRCPNLSHPNQA